MSKNKHLFAKIAVAAATVGIFAFAIPCPTISATSKPIIVEDIMNKDAFVSAVEKGVASAEEPKLYGRLSYIVNDDDTITITKCAKDTMWVKLTGNIEGKPITRIADDAFRNCEKLSAVMLGENITHIGKNAFRNTAIKSVTIDAATTTVDNNAFSDCKDLKSVYVYGKMDENLTLGRNIFSGCNADLTIYCGPMSGWCSYANNNKIGFIRNRQYCVDWEEPGVYIRTTQQDWINRKKRIKPEPEDIGELDIRITEYDDEYYFERSGIYVTKSDYIILVNCTAYEYGANWVPLWEMALVPETIFNIKARTGAASLYDTIVYPNRFEGSSRYSGLDEFAHNKVNDRVITAVNIYLSYPEYFDEGYIQFRGDGTWNYFW